jgi:hypothetical protein
MGQIKHYNNGKWTIYTSGEDLSGYTGTTNTYYIGVNNTDGDLSKVNPDGELINLEKEFRYEIGEYVADEGGVVYHRYKSGITQYYLVVDTEDIGQVDWSDIDNVSSGAISLWDGQGNTNTITTQPGAISGAAFLCTASTNNGKTDWYLPAIQEFNKLWDNMLEVSQGIETAGGSQLTGDIYWSSTERPTTNARTFLFNGTNHGLVGSSPKSNIRYVRAVRKFSI